MLHQIVIGLDGPPLDVELQDSTRIDTLNRRGRSALCYAVKHRRLDYVRDLLEHGADPNIGDPPLWAATAIYADYEITNVLLDYGASLDPNLCPYYRNGWLPWPLGCCDDDDLAIDKLLISRGININHGAVWYGVKDVTILMRLCSHKHKMACHSSRNKCIYQRIEQLLTFGADVEITDAEGKTAIMYAVSAAFSSAFRSLARASARLDVKTLTGSTILHLATTQTWDRRSRQGVSRLCEVMCAEDLTHLDIDAEDEDGKTAYDLLRMRNGPNWKGYCRSKGIDDSLYSRGEEAFLFDYDYVNWEEYIEDEMEAVTALEKMLHHIQEVQGVPEENRYPPLGEYGSRDPEEKEVPGAWPAYED